jgi:hypothetical protein
MDAPDIDDVDRLFARLERTPTPAHLARDVLDAVAARARARRRLGQAAIAAALMLTTLLSFAVGHALRASGGLALVAVVLGDLELARAAPGEVALALVELVPWDLTLLIALSMMTLALAARLALTPMIRPPRPGAVER